MFTPKEDVVPKLYKRMDVFAMVATEIQPGVEK